VKIPRRRFLHLAAGTVASSLGWRRAWAEGYPSRPVRVIVGQAAGSSSDIFSRLMTQWLSERLGQTFLVENRPGASGNVATEFVVNAEPDGYTLMFVNNANANNATLFDNLNFDFIRDIAPIGGMLHVPLVMEVSPSFPAKTVPEFIAYAKANPGKINIASAGSGSVTHVSGELFQYMTGTNMLHVQYRGTSPALVDLMSGQVQAMFDTMASSIEYIKSGKLRALAVTTAARSDVLPDVPAVTEFVPGYEASAWGGFGAPKKTPADIVDKLNKEINAGLADAKVIAGLAALGATPTPGSPADFGKFLADETDKWGKVIKLSGAKPE
jgi:tripartite-type tricarboxylate transporter receptor subunit TctC